MAILTSLTRHNRQRPSELVRQPRGEQHSSRVFTKITIDQARDIRKPKGPSQKSRSVYDKNRQLTEHFTESSDSVSFIKRKLTFEVNTVGGSSKQWNKRKWSEQKPQSVTILCMTLIIAAVGCLAASTENSLGQQDGMTIQQQETTSSSIEPAVTYYQPSLIGFRCESSQDVTPNGVSVIEANSAVTLTLFGDSFTTNTIVAFTTEVGPEQEYGANTPQTTTTAPPSTNKRQLSLIQDIELDSKQSTNASSNQRILATTEMVTQNKRFARRRRTQSTSFDCTDYNRVVSYKLNEENILSSNVAVLVVTLPELASGSGRYYYFCLKQPKLTISDMKSSSQERSLQETPFNESGPHVWVHQGNDWWVTLKVEPPILSITNDCLLIIFLLFLSAVTSGLNLGLMSLDMNELAVISSCGDQRERSYARTIAPLRRRGNYLLCSLLLGNVMVNSTLTVILEEMTSGLVAIIGSTLAIVILGEILPQAFCARQGLAIGARTIYLTYAFMVITFPLSYPISCLLDYVLGEEKGNVYDRERLMEFIKITGHHTQLEADEVAIISGALKLKKIKVDQIMTRIEDVFMLPIDCKLDRETIKRIIEKGYSRIPVYEFGDRKQIVALILAKDLALLDPDDHTPIANMLLYCKHPLIFIEDDATLDVALNEFKTGKSHMAVVRQIYDDGEIDKYYEAIGVVTLEDVIEEVLQVEINDETDTLSDNRRKRRRTDAQVAHLIDEFTGGSSVSLQTASSLALELANNNAANQYQHQSSTPQVATIALSSKQVQTSLSSQLTSVSVHSVAQSVGRSTQISGNQQQQQLQQQQQENQEQPEAGMLSRAAQFLSNIMS